MEQERHGSIFNTQSKDFPQRRIPPALFSLREQGVPRTSGAAYRKKKGFGIKKSGFPKTWQVCLACHRPCFGVSFFWVRKSLVATLSVLTTNRDPPPRSQVVHYSLPYKGISFSWTTPFGLIELSALICYWVTFLY